jgi:hypothetical protein
LNDGSTIFRCVFRLAFFGLTKQKSISSAIPDNTKSAFRMLKENNVHYLKKSIILLGLVSVGGAALAEEEAPTPKTFTYSTYFYCDVTGQDRVDELIKTQNAPVLDKMVKEGLISGWGWLAHHTGGKWRRVQYYQAPSVNALLDAQEEMNKRMDAAYPSDNDEFGKICNAHDDYIWEVETGSGSDERGKAGFSVYYTCDGPKEERADEIWKNDFAPMLNKYVAEGKLSSWGWSSHWVGGAFRRLQTMTGPNHKELLDARAKLIDEMYADGFKPGEEFNAICSSHVDYMWDIQLETRK